jgi:hypothetical protein
MTDKPALIAALHDVTHMYGAKIAVDNISLDTIVQDRIYGSKSCIEARLRRSDKLGLSRTQRQRRTQPCPQYAAFSLKF